MSVSFLADDLRWLQEKLDGLIKYTDSLEKENAELKKQLELMTEDRERWADSACGLEKTLAAIHASEGEGARE